MNIKQSQIWMVNFEPSIGNEIQKLRPAVVVNDDRIGRFGIRIIVPITEYKDYYKDFPWIIKIIPTKNNGLFKVSSIECFQIKSFAIERFVKMIGSIDNDLLVKIHQTMIKTLNPTYQV